CRRDYDPRLTGISKLPLDLMMRRKRRPDATRPLRRFGMMAGKRIVAELPVHTQGCGRDRSSTVRTDERLLAEAAEFGRSFRLAVHAVPQPIQRGLGETGARCKRQRAKQAIANSFRNNDERPSANPIPSMMEALERKDCTALWAMRT